MLRLLRTRGALADRSVRVCAVMSCHFASLGVAMPFLGRWLEAEHGLNGREIGLVFAAAQLLRGATGPLIALWAERCRDRRTPIRVLAFSAMAAYLVLSQVGGLWALVAAGFAAQTLANAITPFVEAAALRAGISGRLPYGVARALGSGAFVIANIAGGALVARFGVGAAMVWIIMALGLAGWQALFGLPPDPNPPAAAAMRFQQRLRAAFTASAEQGVGVLLLAAALIQASHAAYYGLSAVIWRGQGIAADAVGWLWAFAVIVEICLLASLPRLERALRPEAMILAGALGALLRWSLMLFAPPLPWLWPIQALHALSFASSYVGALRLMQREMPESVASFAQTLFASAAMGVWLGLASLAAGAAHDAGKLSSAPSLAYAPMAGLAVLALMLIAARAMGRAAPASARRSPRPPAPPLSPPPGSAPD